MQDILLRQATKEDRQFVDDLTRDVMQDYVDKTWSDMPHRRQYFKDNAFKCEFTRIICENKKPIGRITLIEKSSEIIVDGIHLLPLAQGRGIGGKLLKQTIFEAEKMQKTLSLVVLKSNPALLLYQRLGFVVLSETSERVMMQRS